MSSYPSSNDILESASRFLREDAAPALTGALAFNLRVTLNALDLVRRELALAGAAEARELSRLRSLLGVGGDMAALRVGMFGAEADLATLRNRLCERIETGALSLNDPAVAAHLRATTIDRLAIDQPSYSAFQAATSGIKAAS